MQPSTRKAGATADKRYDCDTKRTSASWAVSKVRCSSTRATRGTISLREFSKRGPSKAAQNIAASIANKLARTLWRRCKEKYLYQCERCALLSPGMRSVSGEYRLIGTAVLSEAAGNFTGDASDYARASAVNYLRGLTTHQVKL